MPEEYSTEPLPQLLARWGRGDITVEQLGGYILQHVFRHDHRLAQLEQAVARLKANPPTGGTPQP